MWGSASEWQGKESVTQQPYSWGVGLGSFYSLRGPEAQITTVLPVRGGRGAGRCCVCAGLRRASYLQLAGMNYKAMQEFSHLCKAHHIEPSGWEGVLLQTLWLFCFLNLLPSWSFCEGNSGNTCSRLLYFTVVFFPLWCVVDCWNPHHSMFLLWKNFFPLIHFQQVPYSNRSMQVLILELQWVLVSLSLGESQR